MQITRIVEAISSETRQAVGDVQNSSQQVDLSVGIAEEANQAMREVQNYNRQLVASIVDIATATRQQSSASQEIAQNVERISGMAQSNKPCAKSAMPSAACASYPANWSNWWGTSSCNRRPLLWEPGLAGLFHCPRPAMRSAKPMAKPNKTRPQAKSNPRRPRGPSLSKSAPPP
ncbi:methyl-accepting chemotaxis protein [Chromobacterium amazonense]|uniref:methyl-accepting chemotaxis protein n=1 Tax=Chromobacterium amazonense TaxID=1382803 RepID=UPI003BB5BFE0